MLGRKYLAGMVLLAASVAAGAGPALTRVEDTLYRADGTKFTGVAFIEWKTFDAADSTNVPSRNLSIRITDGLLRVSLVPTTNATPGAYYRVRFNSDGRTDFVQYWAVPPSSAPLRVRDVRTSGPQSTAGSTPPVNTAIMITDVSGLRDELDNRPSKGGSFVPGHVVIANQDGGLDTVSGNESDCVRVDGTSGPCGGEGFRYIDAETPGGAIDGVNASFTLALTPNPDTGLSLYRNGLLLLAGVDYTISGSQVQFAAGSIPRTGDVVLAYYRLPDPFGGEARQVAGETPSGTLDGSNATYQLAIVPAPAASLQVYRNGLLATAGIDYDLAGASIVFRAGYVPQAGDSLIASYRY